jgi:hypothetical protein
MENDEKSLRSTRSSVKVNSSYLYRTPSPVSCSFARTCTDNFRPRAYPRSISRQLNDLVWSCPDHGSGQLQTARGTSSTENLEVSPAARAVPDWATANRHRGSFAPILFLMLTPWLYDQPRVAGRARSCQQTNIRIALCQYACKGAPSWRRLDIFVLYKKENPPRYEDGNSVVVLVRV